MSDNSVQNPEEKKGADTSVVNTSVDVSSKSDEVVLEKDSFELLFDGLHEGAVIYKAVDGGKDFVFVDANIAAQKLSKFKKEDVIGKKITEVFPGVEKLGLLDLLREVYETGEPKEQPLSKYEDKLRTQWVENYVFKISEDELVAVYRDTTEKYLADMKLKEGEERFKAAFENSAIGMALVSLEGRWLQVNDAIAKMFGYEKDELLEKTFQDVTYPDDLDKDLASVKKLLDGEESSYQMEKRYVRKDGELVWGLLAVSLVKDVNGKPLYFVSQVEDITESKKLESQLRIFKKFVESSNQGFGMGTLDGKIIFLNKKFIEMLRVESLEEVKGESFLKFYSKEMATKLENEAIATVKKGEFWDGELAIVRKDGTVFPTHESYFTISDDEGKPMYIAAIINDVSDRKDKEEELERFNALMVDRELKMADLKEEIKKLKGK